MIEYPNWLSRYTDAIILATEAHHGQVRKYSNQPYILHPLRVSQKILNITGNIELAIAGVLHDVLEDTNIEYSILYGKFGDNVAELVQSVTKLKSILSKSEREEEFLKRFKKARTCTVIIKLADRIDNIMDAVSATEQFKAGYLRNTSELLDAIPNYALNDSIVKQLITEIKLWIQNLY